MAARRRSTLSPLKVPLPKGGWHELRLVRLAAVCSGAVRGSTAAGFAIGLNRHPAAALKQGPSNQGDAHVSHRRSGSHYLGGVTLSAERSLALDLAGGAGTFGTATASVAPAVSPVASMGAGVTAGPPPKTRRRCGDAARPTRLRSLERQNATFKKRRRDALLGLHEDWSDVIIPSQHDDGWRTIMQTRLTIAVSMLAGAAFGGAAIQALHAQAKPPVYMIAINEVSNPDGYAKEYVPPAQKSVKDHGGEYVAAGPGTQLAGKLPVGPVVILRWDSMEALQRWRNSPEFQAALKLGEKYAKFNIVAVNGMK